MAETPKKPGMFQRFSNRIFGAPKSVATQEATIVDKPARFSFNLFGKTSKAKQSETPPKFVSKEMFLERLTPKGRKLSSEEVKKYDQQANNLYTQNIQSIQTWMDNSPAAQQQKAVAKEKTLENTIRKNNASESQSTGVKSPLILNVKLVDKNSEAAKG